jgi:Flp pilus assembly protein TadG
MTPKILKPPATEQFPADPHTEARSGRLPGLRKAHRRDNCGTCDAGAVAVWTLGIVLLAYLAVGVLVDIGGALTAKTSTLDIAQQAARAGAGQLDLAALRETGTLRLDPAAARSAATTFLTEQGAAGTATASTTSVQVTAVTRHPTVLLRIAGLDGLTLSATATAEASNT